MADCYYHGQSFSGPCWACQRNRAAGRDEGDDGDYPKGAKPTAPQPKDYDRTAAVGEGGQHD